MSHFSCIVITDNRPTDDELAAILQPYHEYECTGVKDRYVVEVDITDEVEKEFNRPVDVVVTKEGDVFHRYDNRFYTKESDDEYQRQAGRKQFELPDGAECKTIPADEARTLGLGYATMADAANENYGDPIERDGKFYRLTNQKKWVWMDATGKEVGRTRGDETLPNMQPGPTPGLFYFSDPQQIESGGEVQLLQTVRQSSGTAENSSAAMEGIPKLQIQNDGGGLSENPEGSGEQVRNLQDTAAPLSGKEKLSTPGSLSYNRESEGHSVPGVQQSPWSGKGQSTDSVESSTISNPVKKVLVSGSKWDWWVIGGRWTGMLIPNYKPEEDPRNIEVCNLCGGKGTRTDDIALSMPEQMKESGGCNGCGGKGTRTKWPTEWVRISGDQAMLQDIPLLALREEAETRALARYDRAQAIIGGRPIPVWDEIRERHAPNYDAARTEYNNDPVRQDLLKAEAISVWDKLDDFRLPRDQVAAKARAGVICPFAYIYKGEWHERGEMGWWAMVSNEKDAKSWTEQFQDMIDSLPPTSWLSVIDCHI